MRMHRLQVWNFFTFKDISGSPWDLKSPPNCQDRWNSGDACSKRKAIKSMLPLPGSPDSHPLRVGVGMSGGVQGARA